MNVTSRAGRVEDLIQKDKYQVFLLVCPATLPFSFATHPWFVVNNKCRVSRYGVSWRSANGSGKPLFGQHMCNGCVGHLHKDGRPPSEGIEIFPYSKNFFWRGRIVGSVEGDEGSLAARMVDFVEKSFSTYPYSETYKLLGPNSNTFVGWILEHFYESGMRLPWNAMGKNFRQ